MRVHDVGAVEVGIACGRLVHLARVHSDRDVGVLQAADAGAIDMGREPQSQGIPRERARYVEAGGDGSAGDLVELAAEVEPSRLDCGVQARAVPGTRGQARQIDRVICRVGAH